MRRAPSSAVFRRATLGYMGGGILWDGWHNLFGEVWAFSWDICGNFTNENGDQKKKYARNSSSQPNITSFHHLCVMLPQQSFQHSSVGQVSRKTLLKLTRKNATQMSMTQLQDTGADD